MLVPRRLLRVQAHQSSGEMRSILLAAGEQGTLDDNCISHAAAQGSAFRQLRRLAGTLCCLLGGWAPPPRKTGVSHSYCCV